MVMNSSGNPVDDGPNGENQRLKQIKRLEAGLLKFNNIKKSNSVSKTNILRLVLLPYLRYPSVLFANMNQLLATSIVDLNIDLLLLESKVLFNWWTDLLNLLLLDYNSINGMDKNGYFESLSRLISLNFWLIFQFNRNYSNQIDSVYTKYKNLLLKTFEFSILKLNKKTITPSLNIFIGKVFAYSFFNIDEISKGLLFLLNTKLVNFKKIYNISVFESLSIIKDERLFDEFKTAINDISSKFPPHLLPLITSNLRPRQISFVIESKFINSITPPRDRIAGIRETSGVWVNRWSSYENITLFCSFFRHYLTYSSVYFKNLPPTLINKFHVFSVPGFLVLLTHIFKIFESFFHSMNLNSNKNSSFNSFNINFDNLNFDFNVFLKKFNNSNIFKIFNIIRDFLMFTRHENEILLTNGLIVGIENILKLFCYKTSKLNSFMIEILLNIFTQFIKIIDINKREIYEIIDWEFWINILVDLLNSNNLNSEIKSICTLYQIWNYIPNTKMSDSVSPYWCVDKKDNLKLNLINYLTNDDNWKKFFGHYLPFQRNIYIKLLVWKVLSIDSIENLRIMNNFDFEILNDSNLKFNELFGADKIIYLKLTDTFNKTNQTLVTPMDPVINKKFKVVEKIDENEKKREKLLKVYQFEVLDDAIYTSSSTEIIKKQKKQSSFSSSSSLSSKSSMNSLNTITQKLNGSNDSLTEKKSNNWMNKLFKPSSTSTKQNGKLSRLLNLSSKDENSNTFVNKSCESPGASPINSIASSFSSLELSSMSISTNLDYRNEGNNSEETNKFLPPEFKYNDNLIDLEPFEFQLVNNEPSFNRIFENLGQKVKERQKELLEKCVLNYKPRLPVLSFTRISALNLESLESIVNREDVNLIDLNGGFDDFNDLTLNLNNEPISNDTFNIFERQKKEVNIQSIYLANGINEFNEEVLVFEDFINERLLELDFEDLEIVKNSFSDDEMDSTINKDNLSSKNYYRISENGYRKLLKTIPSIVPDILSSANSKLDGL